MGFWDRFRKPAPAPVEVETAEEVNAEILPTPLSEGSGKINDQAGMEHVVQNNGTLKPTVSTPQYNHRLSEGFNRTYNPPMAIHFGSLFPTKKTKRVYLFNISAMEYRQSRPPNFRNIIIPAKKEHEEFARAFSLPQPLPVTRSNVDTAVSEIVWDDARRVMTDIVNPDNVGFSPKDTKAKFSTSYGNDLSVRGVFWSEHETPTKTELKVARRRMEDHYRGLLEQIWALLASGEHFLKGTITPEHHAAAEYFKQDLPWHPRRPDTKADEKKQTQGA
jgi:hypothetical protein